jgi:DNA-binding XRE family transcriptional regulator
MPSDRPELVAQEMVTKMIQCRLEKELSVNKLAWMSGVSPSAIAFLENGTHSPNLKTFLRIAAALELDVGDLYQEANRSVAP